jgi:hypothetical protein
MDRICSTPLGSGRKKGVQGGSFITPDSIRGYSGLTPAGSDGIRLRRNDTRGGSRTALTYTSEIPIDRDATAEVEDLLHPVFRHRRQILDPHAAVAGQVGGKEDFVSRPRLGKQQEVQNIDRIVEIQVRRKTDRIG